MTRRQADLGKRIAELRRRHFGARGKAEFAQRLGVSGDDLTRFERGTIPPGDLLVRICEETGEDLQWLLTGVGARGTVVISGTRSRHQDLLTRLAAALDSNPALASPVEAFLDLLLAGDAARASRPELPDEQRGLWAPIYPADRAPASFSRQGEPVGATAGLAKRTDTDGAIVARRTAYLSEPAAEVQAGAQAVQIVVAQDDDGAAVEYFQSQNLAMALPGIFGVRIDDDAMAPMFEAGDVALLAPAVAPTPGRPAVYRLSEPSVARCRIWLGEEGDQIVFGRLADQAEERLAPADVAWCYEVLYRLAPAA